MDQNTIDAVMAAGMGARPQVSDADIMAGKALIMRTLASAMTLDLAIAPVILASQPGIGTSTMTRGIAEGLGMEFLDVRCNMISAHEFEPLGVLDSGGAVIDHEPRLAWIHDLLAVGRPTLILLDEAMSTGPVVVTGLLQQIVDAAKAPVIVVLHTSLANEEIALDAIQDGLGIHRAHVPTARLSYTEKLSQPLLLVGSGGTTGSKCGERHFEITTYDPHEAEIRFTVYATPEQDDDALNEALDAVWNGDIAVRLEYVDGRLQCGSRDMESLR